MYFNHPNPLCFDGDGDNNITSLGGRFDVIYYLGIVRVLSLFGIFVYVSLNLGGKALDTIRRHLGKATRLIVEILHIFYRSAYRIFTARRKG